MIMQRPKPSQRRHKQPLNRRSSVKLDPLDHLDRHYSEHERPTPPGQAHYEPIEHPVLFVVLMVIMFALIIGIAIYGDSLREYVVHFFHTS
jgi:hypothetical protein